MLCALCQRTQIPGPFTALQGIHCICYRNCAGSRHCMDSVLRGFCFQPAMCQFILCSTLTGVLGDPEASLQVVPHQHHGMGVLQGRKAGREMSRRARRQGSEQAGRQADLE
jgi:hypothetical protein